ncbi:hypothetical protein CSW38_11445 [Thermus scotoductus]|uniref:Uncharacterized protein n=1 Tax=Thermus scotoductus TaxID=37636 RepID=A0A430RU25_THESC|nr:hypothetical protein CSW51_00680 [Thermus scotoductus]RTH03658.1 hypothetical protein CSW47_08155 [Thermus scotoductus]RTH23114.1 hypothetical protein CSW38_11445 [Thermus scotoductus]RTH97892.1 hypothetical protein CSW29_10915 [Thermus scotoductus]
MHLRLPREGRRSQGVENPRPQGQEGGGPRDRARSPVRPAVPAPRRAERVLSPSSTAGLRATRGSFSSQASAQSR